MIWSWKILENLMKSLIFDMWSWPRLFLSQRKGKGWDVEAFGSTVGLEKHRGFQVLSPPLRHAINGNCTQRRGLPGWKDAWQQRQLSGQRIYGSYRSYPTYFQHTLRSIDQHISPVFGALSRSSHPFFSWKPRQDEERIHDLIRWCMGMGADPRAVALRADAMSVGLPPSPPGTGWKVDLPAIVVGLVFS